MDHLYINARVRGMHRHLLDRGAFKALLLQPDLDSLIADLQKTPYRQDIEKACVQYSGILCVESALRNHLIRTFSGIHRMFKGDPAESYIRVFLNRWDIHNLKTILRGKNIHSTADEIRECLIPAGTLDEATLMELTAQKGVRAIVDLLATWRIDYAVPLSHHLEEWSRERDLVPMEHALDQFYYNFARDTVQKNRYEDLILGDLIRTEIDIANLKSALIFIQDRIGPEEAKQFFLDGGTCIHRSLFNGMIADGTFDSALQRLEKTPYRFLLHTPPEVIRSGRISSMEKELDRYLICRGASVFRADPLSVILVIGYLWKKFNEVTNLRIIARCRDAGLSDEELEAELIYV